MLIENTVFGVVDKVQVAIDLLKKHEPPEGYYVCFSGGKDSVVILDLVKRAGVKFEAWHNITTFEQPELMQFIFKTYPEVQHTHPPKSIYQLIVEKCCLPLRQVRYCCWEFKRPYGNGRFKVKGVRGEESPRRAKLPKVDISETRRELNLIHDWTAADVWEYIHARNLPYCKLYDEGQKRIGCIFCPFAREQQNIENAVKYPQYVKYFITACDRAIKNRLAKGKDSKYKTGAEMFAAWLDGGRGKTLKDYGYFFNFDKGVFIMIEDSKNLTKTNDDAATPTPTLEQRVVKIQFHLQNIGNSIIIIGQELIECKKEVGHGNWGNWLKENFDLSDRTARVYMQIAERFGNSSNSQFRQTSAVLKFSQMTELLLLPAGTEEDFIAEKAAEGTPIENMTIKQEREEIKKYKAKIEKLEKDNKQLTDVAHTLRLENEAFKDQEPQIIEIVKTITPPDYVATVQRAEDLQQQVDQLLEQNEQAQKTIDDLQEQVLDAVSKQGEPPADYLQLEKKLSETRTELLKAKLDAEHAKDVLAVEKYIEQLFQAADALYCSSYFHEANKNYLKKHPNPKDKIAILRCIYEELNKACDLIYKKTK